MCFMPKLHRHFAEFKLITYGAFDGNLKGTGTVIDVVYPIFTVFFHEMIHISDPCSSQVV